MLTHDRFRLTCPCCPPHNFQLFPTRSSLDKFGIRQTTCSTARNNWKYDRVGLVHRKLDPLFRTEQARLELEPGRSLIEPDCWCCCWCWCCCKKRSETRLQPTADSTGLSRVGWLKQESLAGGTMAESLDDYKRPPSCAHVFFHLFGQLLQLAVVLLAFNSVPSDGICQSLSAKVSFLIPRSLHAYAHGSVVSRLVLPSAYSRGACKT